MKIPWIIGLVLVGCGTKAGGEKDYFPTKQGMAWTYAASGREWTVTVDGTEKVGDQECVVFATKDGGTVTKELHAVTDQGVLFYPRDRSNAPYLKIKFGTKKGDTWDWTDGGSTATLENQGEEEIQVPAGEFKALKIVLTSNLQGTELKTVTWYAKGVGMTRQEVSWGQDKGHVTELKRFESK